MSEDRNNVQEKGHGGRPLMHGGHSAVHGHSGHPGHPGMPGAVNEEQPKAVLTYEGWFSLHATYRINFQMWQSWTATERKAALLEFKRFIADLEKEHEAHKSSYALYNASGEKGDLLLWILQPTLEEVNAVKTRLHKLKIAAVLEATSSFVSVIEVSNYMQFDINHPRVQERLYPKIPRLRYMCFYPMSKKREQGDNWFMTDRAERGQMMRSHGQIGRKYEDVIKEFTTGACGLDDWEWGITLMSDDVVQFKKIVYEMRFDEVSARFGLFGSFTVGTLLDDQSLTALFA